MESIHWVLSWACHRRCVHCYDDRFRPYVRGDLERVLSEGERNWPRILANLPDDMTYLDRQGGRRLGRLILAGGEVLLDGFRQRIFLPVLEAADRRWGANRGVRFSIQTTGDLLTEQRIEELLERKVWTIAISGFDDFHVGMEGAKRDKLRTKIDAMMARFGVEETTLGGRGRDYLNEDGPFYLYFGAQPGSWIGELWPRGRAWTNDLSDAGYETNFCARQSGAKRFMELGSAGSEMAVEPSGDLYPCCLKTRAPLGNLTEERLTDIVDSLRGHPVFEALNAGDPEGMGAVFGLDRTAFRAASETITPGGRPYANPCIGCDRLFEAQVGDVVRDLRARRLERARTLVPG